MRKQHPPDPYMLFEDDAVRLLALKNREAWRSITRIAIAAIGTIASFWLSR